MQKEMVYKSMKKMHNTYHRGHEIQSTLRYRYIPFRQYIASAGEDVGKDTQWECKLTLTITEHSTVFPQKSNNGIIISCSKPKGNKSVYEISVLPCWLQSNS